MRCVVMIVLAGWMGGCGASANEAIHVVHAALAIVSLAVGYLARSSTVARV